MQQMTVADNIFGSIFASPLRVKLQWLGAVAVDELYMEYVLIIWMVRCRHPSSWGDFSSRHVHIGCLTFGTWPLIINIH